jgi:hypothetical protein
LIKPISESEFHTLFTRWHYFPTTREVEWWANDPKTVLGTVLLDLIDKDWSLVVLTRDKQKSFRAN